MTTRVNWRMMTQKGRIDDRIDQLFDTAFSRGGIAAYENMTIMGWNALDYDIALTESAATPWLSVNRMQWRKERRVDQFAEPQVAITQIPSGLLIELRLPRLIRESLYIGVRDNILTVTGEQAVATHADNTFDHGERRFQRNFALPPAPARHRVNAYCHGEIIRIIVTKERSVDFTRQTGKLD